MTTEQFARWRDFSMRMARTCFMTLRRPNATWIVGAVEDFFSGFDEPDIPCIVNWDNSTAYPEGHPLHGQRSPWGGDMARCWCVGAMVSEFLDEYRGYAPPCRACRVYEYGDEKCRCEDIEHHYYEQWDEQWGGPVHCCIRAGLDCASAASAGVLGFTAGDVRRMYPDGVPDWVFEPDERLQIWLTDELNGTFAELPDSAGVVL